MDSTLAGMNINSKNDLTVMVELLASCQDLVNKDTFSKSDPVCVLYQKDLRTNQYVEIGRTEQIKNNLNPSWTTKFTLKYHFEERQVLKFSVYDWDGNSNLLDAHDFLGSLECSLGEIVSAGNNKFKKELDLPPNLMNRNKPSLITIASEELGHSAEIIHFKLSASGLDNKDLFGKSDPYLTISKRLDDSSWSQVHKTEVVKNNLNPVWSAFSIRRSHLTGENPSRALRFQVWDWDSDTSSDLIGEFVTNLGEMQSMYDDGRPLFPIINEKKMGKKKYANSGVIRVYLQTIVERSFVELIQNGLQIHFTVAIDFTASNRDPRDPRSLHCINPQTDNQYSLAIKSVGEIIQDYDWDKLFPVLGFGAEFPPEFQVSHDFCLNGNPSSPYCLGVHGILDAYHKALEVVKLSGPTNFAPVIKHVTRMASKYLDDKNYFVLLIITDGLISDMSATKDAIIAASKLPMSIIIVGVGQADFSSMNVLDGDLNALEYNGKTAERDIVQFVELRKYLKLQDPVYTKVALAKDVLAEIPGQVMHYFSKRSTCH